MILPVVVALKGKYDIPGVAAFENISDLVVNQTKY